MISIFRQKRLWIALAAMAMSMAAYSDRAFAQLPYTNLVLDDEANYPAGTLPSSTFWNYDNPGSGPGTETNCGQAGAGQTGVCANWQQNAYYDGKGNLVIAAVKVAGKWTSARLTSFLPNATHQFTYTYGRAEARISMPTSNGLWPAWWQLGADFWQVGWPSCGELDTMEHVKRLGNSTIKGSVHGATTSGSEWTLGQNDTVSGGDVSAYHVYGVIWSSNQVQYYVDGNIYATFTTSNLSSSDIWPFNNNPMFLELDMAVGNWGGPSGATPSPSNMYVDYVRVYQ